MPYDDEQLMSWYDELAEGRPPTGMTSLGVDTDGGVLDLVLRPTTMKLPYSGCSEGSPPMPCES